MDRRFFLKAAGVLASALVITRSTPSEAMPVAPGHLPASGDPEIFPSVATEADVENVRPEEARWVWVGPRRRYWRRRYRRYWRRRYYWRPWRRRYWRRRYWRRRWYY
jgi:hypothetical protein